MTNRMCSLCGRTIYSIQTVDEIYGNMCSHCYSELTNLGLNYITREDAKGQIIYETCLPANQHKNLNSILGRLDITARKSLTKALSDAHKRYIMRPISYKLYNNNAVTISYSGRYRSSLVIIEFIVSNKTVYNVKIFKDTDAKIVQTREFA